jgi:Helix-turn-helix domain
VHPEGVTPAPKTPPAPTLSCSDAATYLGLSLWWLKNARRKGTGPAYLRIGRTIRYRVTDLDEWQLKHRVETRESRAS